MERKVIEKKKTEKSKLIETLPLVKKEQSWHFKYFRDIVKKDNVYKAAPALLFFNNEERKFDLFIVNENILDREHPHRYLLDKANSRFGKNFSKTIIGVNLMCLKNNDLYLYFSEDRAATIKQILKEKNIELEFGDLLDKHGVEKALILKNNLEVDDFESREEIIKPNFSAEELRVDALIAMAREAGLNSSQEKFFQVLVEDAQNNGLSPDYLALIRMAKK